MSNIINILGINISTLNKKNVLEKIEQFLNDGKQHQIVTPNPEFILNARKDEEFFYILNNADLSIPDGIGLKFASWAMGKNLHKFTGADLIKDILRIAEEKNLKIAIINWSGGLSKREDIEKILKEKYPKLKFIIKDIEKTELSSVYPELSSVNDFKPDILFCTLGAPYQEKWIYHVLTPSPSPNQERVAEKKLSSVKIAIGVGGAFDFLTNKIKRAPKLMRALALEWLWRLILEPKYRFRRIYNAIIIFPLTFIKWKFISPLIYRPNVACLLFKRTENNYKILLVKRNDDKNHWQLPQGGTDGENIIKAGDRELREELNTNKFKIIKIHKNLWKYKFGERISEYSAQVKEIVGYKGQKQSLIIAEFLGKDDDIKINFWDQDRKSVV